MTQPVAIDLGTADQDTLDFALKHLSAELPRVAKAPAEVVFQDAETVDPEVAIRYAITPGKVRFHVFPKGGKWPRSIGDRLMRGFSSVSAHVAALEYVPEVDSWYVELRNLPVQMTPALVESLLVQLARA